MTMTDRDRAVLSTYDEKDQLPTFGSHLGWQFRNPHGDVGTDDASPSKRRVPDTLTERNFSSGIPETSH